MRMKFIVFMTLMVFFSIHGSAFITVKTLSGRNRSKVEQALVKNDANFLKKDLKWYKLGWREYSELLKVATGGTTRGKICTPDSFQILADKKSRIRNSKINRYSKKTTYEFYMTKEFIDRLVKNVVDNECEKSVPILRKVLDQDSFFNFGKHYKIPYEMSDTKQLTLLAYIKIVAEACKKKSKEACLALENLKREVLAFEENFQKKAWRKTPEGQEDLLANQICGHYLDWQANLKAMKEEHEKGKISGFVNKVDLKEWGDEAYEEQKEMKKKMAAYKVRFKETFSTKKRCIQP